MKAEGDKKAEAQSKVMKITSAPHRSSTRKKVVPMTRKVGDARMPNGYRYEVIPGKFVETTEEVSGFRPEPDEAGLERIRAAEKKRERKREKARLLKEVADHRRRLAEYGPGIVSELIASGVARNVPIFMGIDLASANLARKSEIE